MDVPEDDDDIDIDTSLFEAIDARESLDVIRAIVQERPHLIRATNAFDATPLHLAAMANLPVGTIRFLYYAWPQALREVNSEQMNPVHCLVDSRNRFVVSGGDGENDALENLKFMLEQWPEALQQKNELENTSLQEAAGNARMPPSVFQFLVGSCPAAQLREPSYSGRLPIHLAASCGLHPAAVQALLDVDPECIHEKDDDGKTPLHHAASGYNVPLVQLLIERGPRALLLERDNQGRVPLHWVAAKVANDNETRGGAADALVSIARVLIGACPDSVKVRGNDGCVPLHVAAECGNVGLARLLVHEWPESVREADPNGLLPLHHVASSEWSVDSEDILDMARFLIHEWPESIHERDRTGRSLLHIAVTWSWSAKNHVPLIDFIIERVPEFLQVQDRRGQLPQHLAERHDVARRLVEAWPPAAQVQDRVGRLPVHCLLMTYAAGRPDEAIDNVDVHREVSRLRAAFALAEAWPDSLLVPDQLGRLPVHVLLERGGGGAALAPDTAPLDEVVALGAASCLVEIRPRALQARDRHGRLPLHVWAAHWKSSSLDAGPVLVEPWPESVLVADYEGRLPLHVLLERGDASLVRTRLLVETNPESLRIQDHQGRLPLHVWMSQPIATLDIARLLIEAHPGSLNVQDRDGRVPLHLAVTNQEPSMEMVQLLVKECPSSLHSLNREGLVPLQSAAAHGAPLDILYFLARQRPELLCHHTSCAVRTRGLLASADRSSKKARR